ncbi:hypothetical protein [Streptomyces sp. NPDC005209]|uniref:hypothetical protein n=1 Tax=Streptomyces sp. NPDC005209 TaxID=3156715 RepID=UPI0033ABC4C3
MEIAGREPPDGGRWDRDVLIRDAGQLRPGETPPLVAAFEADAGGSEPVSCLIAARRLDILPGLVPRHPRAGAHTAPAARDWPGPPLPTD